MTVQDGFVGNPYLIVLRQRRGDRAALAYAFVAVALNPVGTIVQMKMAAVSRLTDFSFEWYPLFTPVSKKSHPSCTTRVTTAGSSKS
jgi:hypothetical protein